MPVGRGSPPQFLTSKHLDRKFVQVNLGPTPGDLLRVLAPAMTDLPRGVTEVAPRFTRLILRHNSLVSMCFRVVNLGVNLRCRGSPLVSSSAVRQPGVPLMHTPSGNPSFAGRPLAGSSVFSTAFRKGACRLPCRTPTVGGRDCNRVAVPRHGTEGGEWQGATSNGDRRGTDLIPPPRSRGSIRPGSPSRQRAPCRPKSPERGPPRHRGTGNPCTPRPPGRRRTWRDSARSAEHPARSAGEGPGWR